MTETTPPEDLFDLVDPYALDALPEADRRAVESWLDGSEDATAIAFRARVRQLRDTLAALSLVDAVPAPPGLEEAVMRAIDEPPADEPVDMTRRRRTWSTRWLAAAAAVLVAIAAGTGIALWYNQSPSPGGITAEQVNQHADARTHTVPMAGGGTVTVDASRQMGAATVVFAAMPTTPPGHVYQLWRIPQGGQPVSAGVLNTIPTTAAPLVVRLDNAGTLAVSLEPAGGSPQPTHPVAAIPLSP